MALYTKSGRPLQVHGTMVYSRSSAVVGRIHRNKVFGPDGRYVGSIANDHLVYRRTEGGEIGSTFLGSPRAATAMATVAGLAIYGDEPTIPA